MPARLHDKKERFLQVSLRMGDATIWTVAILWVELHVWLRGYFKLGKERKKEKEREHKKIKRGGGGGGGEESKDKNKDENI